MTALGPVELDRAVGAVLGTAAGDALGAGYEFTTPGPDHAEMVGGGPFGWAPGQWTDDTSMAVCILEVAATGALDLVAVGDRFLDWYRSDPPDIGNTTRAALAGARGGADLARASAEAFARRGSRTGNGSLMRTAPVALAALGDDRRLVDWAIAVSALTHADPVAGEACAIWCVAIDRAVREGRLDGWWDGVARLDDADARSRWTGWLREAESRPPASFRPNGYVVTALQAAVAAIVSTPVPDEQRCRHLQDALRAAVRIGDDTDTVAAIAGALLGARWGASAVPFAWRRRLHGWPGHRARDLGRLALLAARRGRVDPMGWPAGPSLREAYLRSARPAGTIRPLAEDPGLLVGDVGGLGSVGEHGVDAVVSLCRIGRDDVPAGVEHHESWLIDVEDPATNPNLHFLLDDTAAAIETLRAEGKRVFLHCVHGQRRTPAVAAAYLARTQRLPGLEAFDRVRASLPNVHLNPAFGAALADLWPSPRRVGDAVEGAEV